MFEKESEEICSKYFEENCYKKNKWADTHDLVAMWQDGYNKANEWHYLKDGDLPPEDTKVLALMAGKEICIAHFYRRNVWDKIGTVIAWKEIVLPKEIKEND